MENTVIKHITEMRSRQRKMFYTYIQLASIAFAVSMALLHALEASVAFGVFLFVQFGLFLLHWGYTNIQPDYTIPSLPGLSITDRGQDNTVLDGKPTVRVSYGLFYLTVSGAYHEGPAIFRSNLSISGTDPESRAVAKALSEI